MPVSIQRWSLRRVGLLAAVVLLAGLFIGNASTLFNRNLATKTPLGVQDVGCASVQPLWLEAQAVPSASRVPCVRPLPAGWQLGEVAVNSGRVLLRLDNDRAGTGAVVARLTATCDVSGATRVVADEPGVRRYLRIEQLTPQFAATRLDVFPGGCITARLVAPAPLRAELTTEVPLVLGTTSRETLRRVLEQRSNGRLQLDPAG